MLKRDSLIWAIDSIYNNSDGDLFPKILEIKAICDQRDDFIAAIEEKELSQFPAGASRRFIVPKDEISYRQATQLDPQDNIILTAIMYQYGKGIEERRLPDNIVFSYRFAPDNFTLYSNKRTWNEFWMEAYDKSQNYSHVLYCDIADFYNQIYHHIIENQLIESSFPNQVTKWLINLLESTTAGVSRGVPIGPHSIHLIAEATMIPIDNSLSSQGLEFIRYADDIVIFCNSEQSAKNAIAKIAVVLDKQQRLMLQRHKTKVFESYDFVSLCSKMIEDRPISSEEDDVLKIIDKYSHNNPYTVITYNDISEEDWLLITEERITKIINEYLDQEEVDYIRLRWFYRRLSQIGHPGALNISLKEISKLSPCFANICSYFASIQSIEDNLWKDIGSKLLNLLNIEEVLNNEFFRLSIMSLFTKNKHINHFPILANKYFTSDPFIRREILLAANINSAYDWLREQKEGFTSMDPWQRIAFLYSIAGLPKDEKKYFINRYNFDRPFEKALAKWSKNI